MNRSGIVNFVQIDERTATAGQPTHAQFEALRADGYEAVINLAPDGLATSLPKEADLLHSLGFDYHHIPVAWGDPRLDQLATFTALMDELSGRRVLIHCQANMRVTAFYSLYAMARLGWSAQRAQALRDSIWTTRPGFTMDETWRSFIAAGMAQAAPPA